jgi:hypothetical protein
MSNGQILSVLLSARQLIAKEENWTQRNLARTADGLPIYPTCPIAASWCAVGVLRKVTNDCTTSFWRKDFVTVLEAFVKADSPKSDLAGFNDRHTHQEVLTLFDSAIVFTMLCIAAHEPVEVMLP